MVDNTRDRSEAKLQGENEFIRVVIMICITMTMINNESYTNYKEKAEGGWNI